MPETCQIKQKKAVPAKLSPNPTGIPLAMKEHFEAASGFSFEDVRIHYQSAEPAKIGALAYTQSAHVYIAPGQERHLPHELGHVVQQKQGQVRPTSYLNQAPVNLDARLEADADRQGALYRAGIPGKIPPLLEQRNIIQAIIQGVWVRIHGNLRCTQMQRNADNTYTYRGQVYISTGTQDSDGHDIVTLQTSASAFKFGDTFAADTFRERGRATVETPWGIARVHTLFGGPYVTSRKEDFEGASIGLDYESILTGLAADGRNDREVAQQLLNGFRNDADTNEFLRAATMFYSIVGVAEYTRESDAPWICRAVLRMIANGEASLSEFAECFHMVKSKRKGQKQAQKIRDHYPPPDDRDPPPPPPPSSPPTPHTRHVMDYLSPRT